MMDLRPNAQTLLIVVASRHTCPNSGLTGWGLSNTDLDDIPKVDLLNELRLDTRLLGCVFERDATKLRAVKVFEEPLIEPTGILNAATITAS